MFADFSHPALATAQVRQALSFLGAVARAAETTPLEIREAAWETALQETRSAGTIFDGERVGALLHVWQTSLASEGQAYGLTARASDLLQGGNIRMHVFSHAAFSKYLRGLNAPLPSNLAAVEGHHQRPSLIFLRDTFLRSHISRELSSLRLTANALHESIHLLGPQEPMASEICAFAYDTSLRLFYGDDDFYETILRLHPHRFDLGLLAHIQNVYL